MHVGAVKLLTVICALAFLVAGVGLNQLAGQHRGSGLGPVFLMAAMVLVVAGLSLAAHTVFTGRAELMEFVHGNRSVRKLMAFLSAGAGVAGITAGLYVMINAAGGQPIVQAVPVGVGVVLCWWAFRLLAYGPRREDDPGKDDSCG